MLYHVVAMTPERVIGKNNQLPWHFSSDLKHFKELTMGNTVIMGRKTFEAIGKPLPGRENFVISKSKALNGENLKSFDSIEKAVKEIKTGNGYIIGGASVFEQTLNVVDGIYLTKINAHYEGDAYYPEIPAYFKENSKRILQENPKIEVIFYENTAKMKS